LARSSFRLPFELPSRLRAWKEDYYRTIYMFVNDLETFDLSKRRNRRAIFSTPLRRSPRRRPDSARSATPAPTPGADTWADTTRRTDA
jgi:hypothetical protein